MPPIAFHLLDQHPGLFGKLMGETFDVVGAGQWIDNFGNAGFVLEDQAACCGRCGRKIRWQSNGFIEGIGVQRLRAAEHGRHGLEAVRTMLL
jgi:hypothetical protein